jgi:eukaryotic-like serine/threonine-protein kinase
MMAFMKMVCFIPAAANKLVRTDENPLSQHARLLQRFEHDAEWEKAARGTDERKYPWGDMRPNCRLANYFGCVGATTPVGSYPDGVSPYGALDMAGNVWEWVADRYDKDYHSRSPYDNPIGSAYSPKRVYRGGSWGSNVFLLRVTSRDKRINNTYDLSGGFRCIYLP